MSLAPASGSPLSASGGAPVVNQALEPAWVRHGSASTQKAYATALAFEEMLVEELSQTLAKSSGLGGGESGEESESSEGGVAGGGGSGASGPLSSMLPGALTSGIMSAGGLGLAAQMTHQLASAGIGGASAAGTGTGTGGTNATVPASSHGEAAPATSSTSAATGGTGA